MPRYIDAGVLIGKLVAEKHFYPAIVARAIDDTPTADVVEVKHGEWIYDHWCEFKCSICGHWSQTEPRGKEKYCPNCGARMDGGGKE